MATLKQMMTDAYMSAAAAKVAAAEAEAAKQTLFTAMLNAGIQSETVDIGDGVELTATTVHSSTVQLDWDAIEANLTAEEWADVLITTPSPQKLEALAVVKESVKRVVTDASTEKPRKPYVRLTEKRVDVPENTPVRKRATKIPKPKTQKKS